MSDNSAGIFALSRLGRKDENRTNICAVQDTPSTDMGTKDIKRVESGLYEIWIHVLDFFQPKDTWDFPRATWPKGLCSQWRCCFYRAVLCSTSIIVNYQASIHLNIATLLV